MLKIVKNSNPDGKQSTVQRIARVAAKALRYGAQAGAGLYGGVPSMAVNLGADLIEQGLMGQKSGRDNDGFIATRAIPTTLGAVPAHLLRKFGYSDGPDTGVRMIGMVPCAFVNLSTGTQKPLINISAPGTANQSRILFAPQRASTNPYDTGVFPEGGPESFESAIYRRFKFTRARLHFTGRVPSDAVGALWLGYFPDSAIGGSSVTYQTFHTTPGSINTQVWQPHVTTDVSPFLGGGLDWYYMDGTTSDDAATRQCYQGALMAYWDTPPAATGYYGYIWLEYEVLMVDAAQNGDFALALAQVRATQGAARKAKQLESLRAQLEELKVAPPVSTDLKGSEGKNFSVVHQAEGGEDVDPRRSELSIQYVGSPPSGRISQRPVIRPLEGTRRE